jgi:hypothetical protein
MPGPKTDVTLSTGAEGEGVGAGVFLNMSSSEPDKAAQEFSSCKIFFE